MEAILGASVDLLASRGFAETSTNDIAARAGVSIGSLYQYFPNKDAIATALFEQHARGIDAIVHATLADLRRPELPVREVFRRLLVAFETLHDADPRMARAVDPIADGRQQLAEVVRRRQDHFRNELADALRDRPDVRRADYAVMASLLFDIVDAVARSLMHGDAQRFDRRLALEEATEAICRYIEAPPDAG